MPATPAPSSTVHEAGHAVVMWALGIEIAEVVAGVRSRCTTGPINELCADLGLCDETRALHHAFIVTAFAGGVAENLMEFTWGKPSKGDRDEAEKRAVQLGLIPSESLFADYERQAREILEERRVALEALAAALRERRKLSGSEAVAIVEASGVAGPIADVYAEVRAKWRAREVEADSMLPPC